MDRRRRRRHRSSRRSRDHTRISRLEKHLLNLSNKFDVLNKTVTKSQDGHTKDRSQVRSHHSRESSPTDSVLSMYPGSDLEREFAIPDKEIDFKLETTVKNKIQKSSEEHIGMLNKLQHFDSPDWSQVRFSEAQKGYNTVPGFVELDSNDLVKHLDRNRSLTVSERSLAAISHGLVMQNEALQKGVGLLVNWLMEHDEGSPVTGQQLCEKINDIFDSDYNKINSDLLQMVCGRRADIIQQRRDSILHYVRDKYLREGLRKIPPTSEHLFKEPTFSDFITKHGGVSKVFVNTSYRSSAQGGSSKPSLAQRASDPSTSKTTATRSGPSMQQPASTQGRKRRAADESFRTRRSDKRQRRSAPARGRRRED